MGQTPSVYGHLDEISNSLDRTRQPPSGRQCRPRQAGGAGSRPAPHRNCGDRLSRIGGTHDSARCCPLRRARGRRGEDVALFPLGRNSHRGGSDRIPQRVRGTVPWSAIPALPAAGAAPTAGRSCVRTDERRLADVRGVTSASAASTFQKERHPGFRAFAKPQPRPPSQHVSIIEWHRTQCSLCRISIRSSPPQTGQTRQHAWLSELSGSGCVGEACDAIDSIPFGWCRFQMRIVTTGQLLSHSVRRNRHNRLCRSDHDENWQRGLLRAACGRPNTTFATTGRVSRRGLMPPHDLCGRTEVGDGHAVTLDSKLPGKSDSPQPLGTRCH